MAYNIIIVDGNNMFYKAFSVYKDFSAFSNGKEIFTGGTYGLINSLLSLKRDHSPEKIIVAWDKGHKKRSELYPEYKANRDKSDTEFYDNFYTQMDMAKGMLRSLGIPQASKEGEEADDIVGTLSMNYRDAGKTVLLVSADKDYQQLIDNNIDLLAHKGKNNMRIWNWIEWSELNGFHPHYFSWILGLMGDTADNIPGVPGIGEKGASKLIVENFHLLEGILEGMGNDQLKAYKRIPEKQSAAIKKLLIPENQELFRLSYTLARIDKAIYDIRVDEGHKDMEDVGDLFEMYQFHSLLRKSNWELLEEI